jgi:hypothetical protein
MMLKLSPVDQLIAAKVKVRFASRSKSAVDHTDINDYPEALRSLKAVDPLISGLMTATDKYRGVTKKALDELATSVDQIPNGLKSLGVNPKSIQRFHTQLVNLVKVAKKGDPLRAYSTYAVDCPLRKVKGVLVSLGKAALKSVEVGTKVLKPALVFDYIKQEVVAPFEAVVDACDAWFNFVSSTGDEINDLVTTSMQVHPEPYSIGFTLSPEYKEYASAQREFAEQNSSLLGTVKHNIIGLLLASRGFEDCTDVDLCLTTAAKAVNEAIKLHISFGKEWGDFRAKNQDQESGQRSLFARVSG